MILAAPPVSPLERWGLVSHLPSALSRSGPFGLFWWQWLALVVVLIAGWLLGSLASRLCRALLRRGVSRTKTEADDALLERIAGPLTLGWTAGASYVLLPWVGLHDGAASAATRTFRILAVVALFWAFERSIEVGRRSMAASTWVSERPGTRSLLQLGARAGNVIVFALGVVVVLSELGYPVASLVAGLGIGGLAVALAAQKTLENLFGAFAIATDQPFREGDFVRVDDLLGTVEAIGLRSTKLRTLERTLVSIPNGKLAEMRLETFAVRDRLRFAIIIGLAHGTTPPQVRAIVSGLERVLRENPKCWPDGVPVSFVGITDSALNIEVGTWLQTTNWDEFVRMRAEILLAFLEVIKREGASLATPARSVRMLDEAAPRSST